MWACFLFAWRAYFRCARAPRLCRACAVHVPRVRAVCPFLSLPLSSSAGKPCLIHSYWMYTLSNYLQLVWDLTFFYVSIKARTYLQLPLRQWGACNVYLLVLFSWKVNIAQNPIAVMGLYRVIRLGLRHFRPTICHDLMTL